MKRLLLSMAVSVLTVPLAPPATQGAEPDNGGSFQAVFGKEAVALGLFLSLDRGSSWVKLAELPTVAVDDLVVAAGDYRVTMSYGGTKQQQKVRVEIAPGVETR